MASSVASESILLIAGILVTTAFVGVFAGVVTDLSRGVQTRGESVAEQLNTDVTIINDPQNVQTSPLLVYVKNTGSSTLFASLTEVLVDGQVSTSTTFDVLGSSDDETWRPGDVLEITVSDITPGSGDHRLRVITSNGVEADMTFTV